MTHEEHTPSCVDCGKPLTRANNARCRSCNTRHQWAIGTYANRKPGDRTKRPPATCVDCGKRLSGHDVERCIGCTSHHNSIERNKTASSPNPSGLCWCGCGEQTPLAMRSDRRTGNVQGHPLRFKPGHVRRNLENYRVEDCGYETPCWVWQGAKYDSGYGMARFGPRRLLAHRIVFERHRGPIPDGLCLDHLCRNPSCVNPDHLEPVTLAENSRRAMRTKITEEIATAIRGLRGLVSQTAIGEAFGIDQGTVSDIMTGKTWRPDAVLLRPPRTRKRL